MNDFFNVAVMTPVLHYTMGGLQIDPESRVIDGSGKPIPGLYACGDSAGGFGQHGICRAATYGRLGGWHAAQQQI